MVLHYPFRLGKKTDSVIPLLVFLQVMVEVLDNPILELDPLQTRL